MKKVGKMIRAARTEAGLTLADVGGKMGLSVPYVHDLEKGNRRLSASRWGSLFAALPTINMRAFAERFVLVGPVQIDSQDMTDEQRAALVDVLMSSVLGGSPPKQAQRSRGSK